MKKTWGITKRLNPVIYIENSSIIAKDLDNAFNHLLELHQKINKEFNAKNKNKINYIKTIYENFQTITDYNLNFFRYLKNYKGDLVRQNKVIKNYRFYDEREWRFVPEYTHKNIEASISERKYKTYRSKSINKPLLDKVNLEFSAEDIDYLIVKSKKDIPQLIRSIQGTNNLAKNGDELLELTTRIITIEQLNKDF
ncbi:hypothetical protein BH10BAC2_BH10BAC2_36050 [soil metagenome]